MNTENKAAAPTKKKQEEPVVKKAEPGVSNPNLIDESIGLARTHSLSIDAESGLLIELTE